MRLNKWLFYASRFTLIGEVLGFLYWALAIYGIFLIVDRINSKVAITLALVVYIISVTIIYLFLIKKIKTFFKGKSG